MVKIFISYRRDDSQYVTDTIYEHMARHFGDDNVFLDVGSIPMGVDFRTYLNQQVQAHDVVLVIIGPDWGRIMQERANQANDFVRIEIEGALKMNKLIIPVLVKNATMPDFSQLPESIQELQWRNSARVRRQPDLVNDCNRLADGILQGIQALSTRVVQYMPADSLHLLPEPFEWVEISNHGYSISKYPITNMQYLAFIEAGGYKERQWWLDEGWRIRRKNSWSQPRSWGDDRFGGAMQPVIGISWYEALAFGKWLSTITGDTITLPTEEQWQYAAQGDDERVYPWGNVWDASRCNNSANTQTSDKTTAVNHFEGIGDSPFGVVDMAGNVWEWCLTDYDSGTNFIETPAEKRVLRGGSWKESDAGQFRCDNRYKGSPGAFNENGGFRIVRID